jgi:hypothetical protein
LIFFCFFSCIKTRKIKSAVNPIISVKLGIFSFFFFDKKEPKNQGFVKIRLKIMLCSKQKTCPDDENTTARFTSP